ncbi:PQQ-binding-like beta-propeller repeat protein [Rapidithrix thailandica]|uniref:PQQ-binding-like beta-propeller repeat protein n=1 Tax=Rapidithrix thailandica TaxID=413964 RepID=A0AAW9SBJ0_9BACT
MYYAPSLIFIILSLLCCNQSTFGQNKPLWQFKTQGAIVSSPAIHENTIYFGSADGHLFALNRENGVEIWKYKTEGKVHGSPLLIEDLVIVNNSLGELLALEQASGKLKWKFISKGEKRLDMWDYYLSSPVSDGKHIFWGSGDGHLYALDHSNGKLKWKFLTGGIIHARPLYHEGKLYIGSFDGYMYALHAEQGELIWKFKTVGDAYFPKGEIQRGATLQNGTLYFGSRDFNVYALDATTGTGKWNMKERGSWVVSLPLADDQYVYFGTSDTHAFYCFDAQTGEVIWKRHLGMRVYGGAQRYQDRIYFGCFDGVLYGLNRANGKIEWSFATEGNRQNRQEVFDESGNFRQGFELYGADMETSEQKILAMGSILGTPLIDPTNGIIYFGSTDGNFYAVRLN